MSNIHQPNNILPYPAKTVSYLKISHVSIDDNEIRINKLTLRVKRFFDIVLSLAAIVFVLSWLLPVLAVFIKLNSKGPVFFVQKRVGAFGKLFTCFKLRTMVVNEHANSMKAQINDPRITSLGKLLRVSHLDELPQFFNVLMGDMSLVGPRPHMIRDCKEFSKVINDYNARSFVKPGMTGMAQVKGCRGKTNDFFDISHRYKWDMFYVRNLSFHLDMRIMGLTITSIVSAVYHTFFASKKKKAEEPVSFRFEASEYLN